MLTWQLRSVAWKRQCKEIQKANGKTFRLNKNEVQMERRKKGGKQTVTFKGEAAGL